MTPAAPDKPPASVFTDITFTVDGIHGIDDPLLENYLEKVHKNLEVVLGSDVTLSSHTCNDDGDTWLSLLDKRNTLLQEVADLRQALIELRPPR